MQFALFVLYAGESGFLPKKELLSFEEIIRVSALLTDLGINKIRITGGEPFIRTDIINLLKDLRNLPKKPSLFITTNGVSTEKYLLELKKLGVKGLNISLDAVDSAVFEKITHKNQFNAVWKTILSALELGFEIKINAVVMEGINTDQILPLAALALKYPVEVRFIEEMPFNGSGARAATLSWDYKRIKNVLDAGFLDLKPIDSVFGATSSTFKTPEMVGSVGIIAAFSRTFCGTCNRIRLTATGWLKTCLYDNGVVNVRDILRDGASDQELKNVLLRAFSTRNKDGFEAEKNRRDIPIHESMSLIGG